MGFASDYLATRRIFPDLFKEAPDKNTGIIVVIPAFNEPEISTTLDSLYNCAQPACKTEVLIIVNAPSDSSEEVLISNRKTIEDIESWKKRHNDCFFRLYYFNTDSHDFSKWGVGMARKTGMDEALRRFNMLEKPYGIIASLDADCTIENNYFTCLTSELLEKKERLGCSIYFEHPLNGELSSGIYNSIILYELHLRCFFQALKFCGFPNVHHTIGSAIAVKASLYSKEGGMNRRQAGEDFYFIQKLVQSGGFFNLNCTTIYPSPRVSDRVPFGTGLAIGKLNEMNKPEFYTYDLNSFASLKMLFGKTESLFHGDQQKVSEIFRNLPEGLKSFIGEDEWNEKISEIKANTSNCESFTKRFYNWFNMFKIVKYLNFVHLTYYNKKEVVNEAKLLSGYIGCDRVPSDPAELLFFYRSLEKKS